ncbi:MAG: GNAT family N-acetyltransferase [Candidatus Acidiferrales bacterium]
MAVRLIERLNEKQVEELTALYQKEWWTKERRIEDVRRMLAGTDILIALEDTETGELVAFARVLTDGVYRAHLFDVIVKESHRGQGLGRAIVDAVVANPALSSVEKIIPSCKPELVPFYERWGFSTDLGGDQRFLVRSVKGVS